MFNSYQYHKVQDQIKVQNEQIIKKQRNQKKLKEVNNVLTLKYKERVANFIKSQVIDKNSDMVSIDDEFMKT